LTVTASFRYKNSHYGKELSIMNIYPFFEVEKHVEQRTAVLYLNRPEKLNAMSWPFWHDLPFVVDDLEKDPDVRVVIIAGRGKSFSVGIDVFEFFVNNQDTLVGATPEFRERLYDLILQMQQGFNRMSEGNNIYIAAVHRHCIGGALDLISACDLRLASKDAVFSLRETKIAIVADMGSLNRLPNIIGQGNTRMLALTGRDFPADSALRMGLINELYENQEDLMKGALELAGEIAGNADNAVRGTKKVLNYMENHSVEDGLKYVATWNAAFFNTGEVQKAFQRSMESKKK
jgi:enoyl-CoA hydratase